MKKKSDKRGKRTSEAEVSNISSRGLWLLLDERELYLPFKAFPWFRQASVAAVSHVERPAPGHLYWPDLDVDLTVESIEQPSKYPLVSRERPVASGALRPTRARKQAAPPEHPGSPRLVGRDSMGGASASPITTSGAKGSSPSRGLEGALRQLVGQVLGQEGRQGGEIGVVLADDPILREFNRRWRKIDRATDVISFAYDEQTADRETRPVTGDIVISMDRVRAQAKRYRVTPGRELARLVIHGTLHLCGHDHVRAAQRRVMREREKLAMKAATIPIRALEKKLASSKAR